MARKSISDLWTPGQVIDDRVFRVGVQNGGTYAVPTGYSNAIAHSDGRLLKFDYTPPVNCWWEVDAWIYYSKSDAAYGYVYTRINLTPADADGTADTDAIMGGMHSGVVTYATVHASEKWKLVAGVAYTAQVMAYASVTGFMFQRGDRYSGLKAVARVR